MLILIKSILCIILGIILSLIIGFFLINFFKKIGIGQSVSHHINIRHLKKEGTPTMGGFIFIIPTIILLIFLWIKGSINLSYNFLLIILTFILYGLLGFIDDYLKIHFHDNKGLSILSKFFIELIIAIIFFFIYLYSGNNTIINIFNIQIDLKYFYGIFILVMISGFSNAVNITDGLDGLACGLSIISFLTFGILAWNSPYIIGNNEIAIFSFILCGSLLGFLFYNFYPAKIFMGDLGSLSLGASLAAISIILKKELVIIIIGLVFIIETLSSLIQILSIKIFNKKILLKAPLHHHFEELGLIESDIIKIFYLIGLFCSLIALIYYVWI